MCTLTTEYCLLYKDSYASTPNDTLAINVGSKNRSGTLSAMTHMNYNDTCAMAALRAEQGSSETVR